MIVLLALLAILVAAGALVSRTTQGQLGSIANSQTYGARKAAEAGISRLIGEWNQQSNRMLLASGSPASSWTTTSKWLRNPCTATTTSLSSATAIGGTDLASYRTGDWILVVSGDTTRRYRLRRLTFSVRKNNTWSSSTVYTQTAFGTDSLSASYPNLSASTDNTAVGKPFTLGDPTNSNGYLEVEVEGQVLSGATVVASSRVVKQFQVVPKCCKRSFGRTLGTWNTGADTDFVIYGDDWRRCEPPSGFTPGKLAMLTGLNGGGLNTDNGNSWWLRVDGTNPPRKVDPIICTTSALACDGPDGDTAPDSSQVWIDATDGVIAVDAYDLKMPDPPLLPAGGFTYGPSDSRNVNGGGALRQESLSPADDGVAGVISLPSLGLNQQGNTKYCGYKSGAFHCQITAIRLPGNKILEVDTTQAPVYLYLQDPSGTIDIRGSAGLRHVYNGQAAPAYLADRFQIRGEPGPSATYNPNPTSQDFELSGDSVNTSMFIWAPLANLALGGNSTYRGLAWVNNLGFYGNTQVTVPSPNGLDDTCPEILEPTMVYCRLFREIFPAQIPLAFDWQARSETYTKFHGAP